MILVPFSTQEQVKLDLTLWIKGRFSVFKIMFRRIFGNNRETVRASIAKSV